MTRAQVAGAVFFTAAAATLAFYAGVSLGWFERGSALHWATKPLVLPALLAWVAITVHGRPLAEIRKPALYAGFVLSAVGDTAFIPGGKTGGVVGVIAFGLVHVCYVIALLRPGHLRVALPRLESLGLVALATYAYLVRGLIREGIPNEAILVFDLYMVCILATGASALVRFIARGDRASGLILSGAVLFLESDSLIAARAVGEKLPGREVAVMATYIAGQFLIARGVMVTEDARPEALTSR